MANSNKDNRLENTSVWTVWYEDRFGIGDDRDPASLVALFLEKTEAENYIHTHEGPIDIPSGKFDGLFAKEWLARELINAKLARTDDLNRLSKMQPPARLLKHWEKGWI